MKKSLSSREIILISLLVCLAIGAGYVLLWYTPLTQQKDDALEQVSKLDADLIVAQVKAEEVTRMQSELDNMETEGSNARPIAKYDNLKPVMQELNTILAQTQDFSVTFGDVDTSSALVKRNITLSFQCEGYGAARDILQQLSNSKNRCMIEDLSISPAGSTPAAGIYQGPSTSSGGGAQSNAPDINSGPVAVNATLVFFEFKE